MLLNKNQELKELINKNYEPKEGKMVFIWRIKKILCNL